MIFCPPEGTPIVPSPELRIMELWGESLESEWEKSQDYSSLRWMPDRTLKINFLCFILNLLFPSLHTLPSTKHMRKKFQAYSWIQCKVYVKGELEIVVKSCIPHFHQRDYIYFFKNVATWRIWKNDKKLVFLSYILVI